MANLTATSSFDAVLQLETTHQAIGGAGGTMNLQAQALLNRTQYLLDQVNTKTTLTEVKTNLNVTGSAPMYVARAWVTFNSYTATIGVLNSGNISSITDNGVGNYTLNFTTAMPDANYAVLGTTLMDSSNNVSSLSVQVDGSHSSGPTQKTTSAVRVGLANGSGRYDAVNIYVAVFG